MKTQKHTTIELSDTVEIPWNQLRKDGANVRMVRPDNAEDATLIANIGETGVILENLIVTPIKSDDGADAFGVHAGGRRWSAIGVNVKNGALSKPSRCLADEFAALHRLKLAQIAKRQ